VTLSFSFEVFPPKHRDGLEPLAQVATELQRADPAFISVTYGAGGSDRQRSFEAIEAVRSTGSEIAGHLTCVGQTRGDIEDIVDRYVALGVHQVVALRGDPPGGIDDKYVPHPDGFRSTADLVAVIKNRSNLEVAVSAYPERHPQSPTDDHDLAILADKVAAGADRAMTQMFFDNQHYYRYRQAVQAKAIDVTIVPGIFPIHSYPAVARFAARCGASIPARITERFAGLDEDPDTTHKIAAELAAEQISELAAEGVEHVHIYTLNRSELALSVCDLLSRPHAYTR
jgi:methylenetetrahydrofolate reductase (NADPH)